MGQIYDRLNVRIIRMRKVSFHRLYGYSQPDYACEMSQREKTTVLSGVNDKVHQTLEKSGFYELLGEENICPNINAALRRAEELMSKD